MTDTMPASLPPDLNPNAMPATIAAQYIKDFSFESPNAPQIFSPVQTAPEIMMAVNIHTRVLNAPPAATEAPPAPTSFEVLLALKMEAKVDGKTGFIAELVYGGVFILPPASSDQHRLFLLVEAPRLLFPFARTILVNAVREGGFPQVLISPIDFMALYNANKNNISSMTTAGAA